MFLLALQFGSSDSYAWSSATIIGLFVGAGILALIFFVWEYKQGDQAMLPGNLLCQRIVWTSCAFGMCLVCCLSIATNWLPTYFQAVKGNEPTMSGVSLLPSIISQLIFVIISGASTTRLGYYLPFALFSGVTTALGNGLVSTFEARTSAAKWISYQVVMGIGRGAGMQMVRLLVVTFWLHREIHLLFSHLIATLYARSKTYSLLTILIGPRSNPERHSHFQNPYWHGFPYILPKLWYFRRCCNQ